ncbi:MAG: hypothetical protein V3U56_11975 [Syntrophobacteria bacterium]
MDDLSQAMKDATAYLDRQKDEKKEVQPKKEVKSAPKVSAVKRKTMEVQSNPALVLAYGGAIALAIFAVGISTQWLIPALAAGFGIATNIISKGILTPGSEYSWVISIGAGGLALIGGVAVVFLLIKIVRQARGHLYLAVLPLLGVLAGFSVDLCKDFFPNDPLVRIGFAAVATCLFVLGGLWLKRYGLLNKIAGTFLMLLSPLVILAHGVSENIDQGWGAALGKVTTQSWIALGGLLAILVLIGLLAFTLGDEINPG